MAEKSRAMTVEEFGSMTAAQIAERYKKAKTAREMVESWAPPGTDLTEAWKSFGVYCDKAPHIIKTYMHDPVTQVYERNVLDVKTKELVMLGLCAIMKCPGGVAFHMQSALRKGATEAEVMEVLFLVAYELAKNTLADIGEAVTLGFEQAAAEAEAKTAAEV